MIAMYGADAEELDRAAAASIHAADVLRRCRLDLNARLATTDWRGPAAVHFRQDWQVGHARRLHAAEAFLRDGAQRLRANAAAQRQASAAGSGGAGPRHTGRPVPSTVDPHRVGRFGVFGSGRDAVVAALDEAANEDHVGKGEIQVRQLDNGRYIVVLPGVTDLSGGNHVKEWTIEGARNGALLNLGNPLLGAVGGALGGATSAVGAQIVGMATNDAATVRKMRNAGPEGVGDGSNRNPYSEIVKQRLQEAGVPPGAEVMIVGHSYGAYTAMDLAADTSFNHDGSEGAYHVNITHVVAAAAETDWRFSHVPSSTNVLVLNNRHDLVYQAEDKIHWLNGDAVHQGQLEVVFNGGDEGAGHAVRNYTNWLEAATDHQDLGAWLDDAGRSYSGSGSSYPLSVETSKP